MDIILQLHGSRVTSNKKSHVLPFFNTPQKGPTCFNPILMPNMIEHANINIVLNCSRAKNVFEILPTPYPPPHLPNQTL